MNKEDFMGFYQFAVEVANGLAQRDQQIKELSQRVKELEAPKQVSHS